MTVQRRLESDHVVMHWTTCIVYSQWLLIMTFRGAECLPQVVFQSSSDSGLHLRIDSTLTELTLYDSAISVDRPGSELIQVFEQNPLLPGILLEAEGSYCGMLSRRYFFEQMSRPYSLELFSRRSLQVFQELHDRPTLVLSCHTSVMMAAATALQRSPELLYEPLVVECNHCQHCLLDIHQLLLAQSKLQEMVTEALQQSQQALIEEKELAQITLQSIGDAVITTDALGILKSLNPVAERITGWSSQEAAGLRLADVLQLVSEQTRQPLPNLVESVLQGQPSVKENHHALLLSRTGEEFAVDETVSPILDRDGQIVGTVLVFRDVTEARDMSRQLSWQARHDPLTGLINRREFERQLHLLEQPTEMCDRHLVCYLDLDRFKIVNDTCGHLAGDELLRQVSFLLQQQIRKTDTLSRLGGDEFGLLLFDCPMEQGMAIAEDIRQSLQNFRFSWQNKTFSIGVSIGLTQVISGSMDVTEVMRQADTACYAAKNQGRNAVCVYQAPTAAEHPQEEIQWITKINQSLDESRFQLFYQAIVPLTDPTAHSQHWEILVRMIGQQGELVLPNAFMPAAERYNLMAEIDRWVMRQVLTTLQHDRESSQPKFQDCTIAINLSDASLKQEQLLHGLQTQLTTYAVSPSQLCFEVTESVAIANFTQAMRVLESLKQLGCSVALDDFGSGMSSFPYLRRLPVDYLKIDGNLVCEITTDAIARELVDAINRIGHTIGWHTIAECVETPETLGQLTAIGVDYAQGHHFSQPQPFQ